jgi:hypothetical protein
VVWEDGGGNPASYPIQCPEQDPPQRRRVSSASGGLNLNSTLLWEYEIKKPPQTTRGLFDSVPGTGYTLGSSCKLAEIRRHFRCHDRAAECYALDSVLLTDPQSASNHTMGEVSGKGFTVCLDYGVGGPYLS